MGDYDQFQEFSLKELEEDQKEGKYLSKNQSLKSKSIVCNQFIQNKGIITDNEYEVTSEIEKEE